MLASDNYCIRADYVVRTPNRTVAPESGAAYWSPRQIHMAKFYQYGVYQCGRELIVRHGLKNVLDIGCGPATKLAELIAPVCRNIVGLDEPGVIAYCGQQYGFGRFMTYDIEGDSFLLQETFDLIISADVIEHLVDPDKLLIAIHTAAGPESLILISTPERDRLRGKDCLSSPKAVHVREWSFAEFAAYLKSRGFTVLEHRLAPPLSFNWSREFFRQWYSQFRAGRPFDTCQMVICKKA